MEEIKVIDTILDFGHEWSVTSLKFSKEDGSVHIYLTYTQKSGIISIF